MAPPKKKRRQYYQADRAPPPYYPPKISRWAASRKELKPGIEEKGWYFLSHRCVLCPGLLLCRGQGAGQTECI
eukprot:13689051-Alexandrium_andersonii.AAC.1